LRVPRPLYDEARRLATDENGPASVNDVFVTAIRTYLRMLRRKRIDAEFENMASDAAYRDNSSHLAEDFAASDSEALQLEEQRLSGNRTGGSISRT